MMFCFWIVKFIILCPVKCDMNANVKMEVQFASVPP